jgi:hypothetical protein
MAMTRRTSLLLVTVMALALLLGWLRDPSWLSGMTSGLGPWTRDDAGVAGRWTGGRASFFIPADARVVRIPIRTVFHDPSDWAVVVSIGIDGRPADRLELDSAEWRTVEIQLPPRGSRRYRRIDVHVDRLRTGERGVFLGEVELLR